MVRSAGTVSWGIGGGFQIADIERRTAPRCNDVRIPFLTLAALWNTLLPKLLSERPKPVNVPVSVHIAIFLLAHQPEGGTRHDQIDGTVLHRAQHVQAISKQHLAAFRFEVGFRFCRCHVRASRTMSFIAVRASRLNTSTIKAAEQVKCLVFPTAPGAAGQLGGGRPRKWASEAERLRAYRAAHRTETSQYR